MEHGVDVAFPRAATPRAAARSSSDDTRGGPAGAFVAVVIPCYRTTRKILDVLARIGPEVARIYVVDDACPDDTGEHVARHCRDARVVTLRHAVNQGVGGAVITGYRAAVADGADVVVKIDGDGQMDPALLPSLIAPIVAGEADYAKGNRFFHLEDVRAMPAVRLVGNAILSFMAKLSTGYWDLFDPTNGYTAIHARVLAHLPTQKIARRYFFETDMLFRLNTMHAVVVDVPMPAVYADEESGLRVLDVIPEFIARHLGNFGKRLFYGYFLRGFSLASIELVLAVVLLAFGLVFGGYHWWRAIAYQAVTPLGTIMLAAVAILLGVQFGLNFLAFDMRARPDRPIHRRLPERVKAAARAERR